MYASCAAEIATVPSAGDGHKNRPRSSRFAYSDMPIPSCQRLLEQDHRQQAGTRPAAREHVERSRGLADLASAGVGLARGQHRHGGVVAVQPVGGKDMRLDPAQQRRQHGAARADLVGQGRQAERHALAGIALGLAIERLMLPVPAPREFCVLP